MEFKQPLLFKKNIKPWQIKVTKLFKEQNNRQILWIVDIKGGVGKTKWCRDFYRKNEKLSFYVFGKAGDMKDALAEMFHSKQKIEKKYIMIDIPRNMNTVSYNDIERIKNGFFVSMKFKGKLVDYKKYTWPNVLIMTNWKPDRSRLSADRLVVKGIYDDDLYDYDKLDNIIKHDKFKILN